MFTGRTETGSLKVPFFGPFYGGYQVAALDGVYRWALVVRPDAGYAWILALDRALAHEVKASIVERPKVLGVGTSALISVGHTHTDPALAPTRRLQ